MPLSPPSRSALSNLRQYALPGVAGASAMSVGVWLRFRGFVEDVEGTWSAVKGDEASFGGFGEQNVGQGVGEGVEKSKKGGDGRRGGFVRGDVDDARCQPWREVLGAMWNASAVEVLMLMRVREQEGADSWRSFRGVDDSIENWYSSCACSLEGVWAGISRGGSAKVMSNADSQNKSDLVIERNVADLCWFEKDVTVLCPSVILKYTNAGRELQRNAIQNEALADADSLLQNIRRPFCLIQIVENRPGQDRRVSVYDPKLYSATFKKQVFDGQSLRLLVDCSATSGQPDVLQHWQPYLYRGFNDSSFPSLMVLGWRSIWTMWHYSVNEVGCSISISVKEACVNNSWISQERFFFKLLHC